MAVFYNPGEQKHRPGVYNRIVNRDFVAGGVPAATPDFPDDNDGIMVACVGRGIVTLLVPGCTVAYDENGTVTLSGLASAENDNNGNVMIGG